MSWITGLNSTVAEVQRIGKEAEVAVGAVTIAHGALLQTTVRANASTGTHPPNQNHIPGTGPGPNVATGDYRRSITRETKRSAHLIGTYVSTRAAQAYRLELGFIGADSLGRFYRQPAYPHWQPATAEIEPVFYKAVEAALDHVIGGP